MILSVRVTPNPGVLPGELCIDLMKDGETKGYQAAFEEGDTVVYSTKYRNVTPFAKDVRDCVAGRGELHSPFSL